MLLAESRVKLNCNKFKSKNFGNIQTMGQSNNRLPKPKFCTFFCKKAELIGGGLGERRQIPQHHRPLEGRIALRMLDC